MNPSTVRPASPVRPPAAGSFGCGARNSAGRPHWARPRSRFRHAAAGQFPPHALAQRHHRIGPAQQPRLERAGRAVAQITLAGMAEINRRVLPQAAHLVDERQAGPASGAQRRPADQNRRVGMDDVRALARITSVSRAASARISSASRAMRRAQRAAVRPRGAMESPAVDGLGRRAPFVVPRTGELDRVPAETALRARMPSERYT